MAYSTNLTSITIDHLLTHTSGGWGDGIGGDTMFDRTDLDHDGLITWTIDTFPQVNAPGTIFAYSNFGYCLLGRIIERATGMSYEAWVAGNTLSQCGITGMQIAGDSLSERADDEVVYDGTNAPIEGTSKSLGDPYGIPVRRMDAHGGWIATATDLLRVLVHTDGLDTSYDIIIADSVTNMTTGTMANPGYGRGWGIATAGSKWGHTGRLAGTESVVSKQAGGICFAVIANGNDIDTNQLGLDMANAVDDWGPGTPL